MDNLEKIKTNNVDYLLDRLSQSKFRNSFHLKQKDFDYIDAKGLDVIKSHAQDFITKRLKDKNLFTDGKQTPTKGHPVFVAQHATATCCRECLYKWHKIENTPILTDAECDYVVDVIMQWINKEINCKKY